jgi:hypothetical protein
MEHHEYRRYSIGSWEDLTTPPDLLVEDVFNQTIVFATLFGHQNLSNLPNQCTRHKPARFVGAT